MLTKARHSERIVGSSGRGNPGITMSSSLVLASWREGKAHFCPAARRVLFSPQPCFRQRWGFFKDMITPSLSGRTRGTVGWGTPNRTQEA